MLGAIIGDIAGSRWEFNPVPGNDYNFQLFSEKNSFTDDTICTIAVADAILNGSDDYGSYIHKWCRKYPRPMGGYGGRFAMWVNSNNPQPYNSYGNGSAMRVSPIGWFFDDTFDMLTEAGKSAACTHNHDEGIKGAKAVAWAIKDCYVLRQKHKPGEITPELILDKGIYSAVSLYCDQPIRFDLDLTKYVNRFDETCQGTVPIALWIVQHSHGFEDAVRLAVSMGADADTLGAITGSIAEALWGIPEWMIQKALSYLPSEMQKVVKDFHKLVLEKRAQKQIEKENPEQKKEEPHEPTKEELDSIMHWKLGLGDMNKYLSGEDPMPEKKCAPTQEMIDEYEPMPTNNVSCIELAIPIAADDIKILKQGHIPDSMEDHWFMYTDDEYIRYFRSWSGMCAFEAHYKPEQEHYVIDKIRINRAISEFGVNGDKAGIMLFRYLVSAEIGADATSAWQEYIDALENH